MKLILASSSPRRAEILRNAGFVFGVYAPDVDESLLAGERAEDYVQRLADTKARLAAANAVPCGEHAIVLGADTTVVADGQILGKPAGAEEARRMLHLLSGKTHEVVTGVRAVRLPGGAEARGVEKTRVKIAVLSEEEISEYLATGEPFGKAGAYAIQGVGGKLVPWIEGCYFNVMGLPLARVNSLLKQLGWRDSASKVADA